MKFSLKTPQFWRKKNSLLSYILWPISIIYQCVVKLRYLLQNPETVSSPVICIGNATVGGSGKTPTAIALGKLLKKHKYKIAFACKNYNATIKQPTKVTKQHTCIEIVEEAMLLSEVAPTYVAHNRLDAIKLAAHTKPDIIIADDGLQNNTFYKNLAILVIDHNLELTNNFLFPAGPFREPLKQSIEKSDIILNINPKKKTTTKNNVNTKTTFQLPKNHKKEYIAFTGLAFPEKFFNTLENLGIKLDKRILFPDHHIYQDKELKTLVELSKTKKITLITTKKDFIKIPSKHKKNIDTLIMDLDILNEDILLKAIQQKCIK